MTTLSWGRQPKYGEYEIVGARENKPRLLGEGSFGKTYEAMRSDKVAGERINEYVAVKVLNPELLNSDAKRFQFIQEILALTKFKHSNLIHYIRCGEENGEVYYAMELCRGGDLTRLVKRYGPLSEKVAALIGLQIAAGLRELHQRHRLVHRDIKPSNVMVVDELEKEIERKHLAFRFEQQDSLCRVVDFGLVNFTLEAGDTPQRFVGSPMYASPEQIREQPIDGRCDIYSLGMTLWYLVQGKGPLLNSAGEELTDMRECIRRHLSADEWDEELPQGISPEFRRLLSRLLMKRPEQRLANAGEVQNALRDYLNANVVQEEPRYTVTRVDQPLDSLFILEEKISSRASSPSYAAKDKASGKRVRVTVAANVEPGKKCAKAEETAGRLCKLAELSKQPSLPEALAPVGAVVWASDVLAYTEEMVPQIALSEVLRARANAKRPISFSEAVVILRPISDALDFLLHNKQETVSLPCEEIWLSGPTVAAITHDAHLMISPLNEWQELQVRFSMIYLPPAEDELESSSESFAGRTMSGSLQMSAADLHPVPAFARLIYRIINGSEVAAAVQFAADAYVPAVTLGHASNNLLRDILSRKRSWEEPSSVLKEMCANEGVVLRTQAGPATARVVSPGVAVSPYSPSGSTQQIPWEQWKPGGEFTCAETGRRVILPLNLPPRETAPPPAGSHGHTPSVGGPPLRVQRMQDRLLPAEPPRQPLPGNSQSPTVWSEDPPPPVAPPEPVIKRVESAPHKPRTQTSTAPPARTPPPAPTPSPAAPQMTPLQALAKHLPIPLLPAAAIAAVVLLAFIGLIWHFASSKPPVIVAKTTPAPAPATVTPPVEPASKVQHASTAAIPKTLPFQKGEKWENSLGMKLAPLGGTENSLAVWPTRVRDFQAFTEAAGYEVEGGMLSYSASGWTDQGANWKTPGFFQSPVHPVVGVSADDAKAFCRWLTQKERDANLIDDSQAYRLPTDEEWGQIAGSGPYAWGSAWPPPGGAGNFASEEAATRLAAGEVISGYHDGFSTTSPVGSFSPNAHGLYDLAGNVCQWCLTPYTPDLNSAEVRTKNPHENDFPNATSLLVLRGSSCFDGDPTTLRSDYRRGAPPSLRAAYAGFRVVLGPLVQEPPPQIARASDNPNKPSDAPADKDIPKAEPVKPADAAPTATTTTVDPEVIGVWTTKGPKGKIEKLEVKADGTYTYSGPNPGSGTLSTDSGQFKQNSTSGGDAVSSGYDIKGNTLTLNGPNGPVEWRRTGGGTSGDSGGEARRHSGTTQQRVGPKPGGVIDHLEKVFKIFH